MRATAEDQDALVPTSPRFIQLGWLLLAVDTSAALVAVVLALAVRLETTDLAIALAPYLPAALIPIVVRLPILALFGLYRREWRHASVRDLLDLAVAVVIGSMLIVPLLIVASVVGIEGMRPVPRSFFLLEPIFFLGFAAGARLLTRTVLERQFTRVARGAPPEPTLIYGAGDAGAIVGRMMASGVLPNQRVVGYIDDDRSKRGSRLFGQPVMGSLDEIGPIVERTNATTLLVAIPSANAATIRRAVDAAQLRGLSVKIVPPLRDLVTGRYKVSGIRAVSVEDLLRRVPVEINTEAIGSSINGASVVVTGGGGSIGGELVRQILTLGPRTLTVVEYHEWALWNIERDIAALVKGGDGARVVAALADVRSPEALDAVFRRARPDVVFHAAGLKHVPYVELFPAEGVLTNVIGTRNVVRACERLNVPRFVLISTDKAVEPVSVMGITKRLAEQLTVAAGRRTGHAYMAVRFGNVLGSGGSIVPLLQRQLDDGLPLTITEPDATRYFMTISEAVSLILEAGADPTAGDVYVLDMGEPVRIMDLARDLVRLNGLDPDTVTFSIIGLRPGERLHEKLLYDDEIAERTNHPGIRRVHRVFEADVDDRIEGIVDDLARAAREHNDEAVREMLASSSLITGAPGTFASAGIASGLDR